MEEQPADHDDNGLRADRLQSLGLGAPRERGDSRRYSMILKGLKITMPLAAIGLLLLLVTWQRVDDLDVAPPIEQSAPSVRSVGKNELLNPKFESADDQGNPYIVSAKRALQGQSEEDDLIILEEPVADIALEGGNWLAVKAEQSAYRQETQRLLLKSDVEIFHDEGYTLSSEELDVDMKAGFARTDTDVHVQGPKGSVESRGLQADREAGLLVFKGPAKLTLHEGL